MNWIIALILLMNTSVNQNAIKATTKDGVEITIESETGDEREIVAARKLKSILEKYELKDWIFSTRVMISNDGLPHSHPVITLTTESEYFDNPQSQLATFIHEQLHWYEEENLKRIKAAIKDLKKMYKDVPVGGGQGARSEYSTYLHLIVGWLEYDATVELYGEKVANQLLNEKDHYRWIYGTIENDKIKIGEIIDSNHLMITPDKGITW